MNQEQIQRSVLQNVMNDVHATYTLLKLRNDRDRVGREEKPLRRNMSERMNLASSGDDSFLDSTCPLLLPGHRRRGNFGFLIGGLVLGGLGFIAGVGGFCHHADHG
jgi:hypothetical protein